MQVTGSRSLMQPATRLLHKVVAWWGILAGALFANCLFVLVRTEAREPWTSSRLIGTPEAPKPYHIERLNPELNLTQPVEWMPIPGSDRILVLEVGGKVVTYVDHPTTKTAAVAVDLAEGNEQFARAFGIGLHPDFETVKEVFIVYGLKKIAQPDGNRLSRFRITRMDPPTIDRGSEEILLTWPSGGHSGAAIRFDKDGYLYFSAGDGARPFPPDEYNVSQDISDLRATICRIDIRGRDGDRGYRIPSDNPFIDTPNARPEVWAYGFRNPWRFSIDPLTQDLLCGDVGWELWELVHRVERGGNYGWAIFEGPQVLRSDLTPGPTPIQKPLHAYPHTDGLSVTGGFVYRGAAHPDLQGAYLFGDYINGKVWAIRYQGNRLTSHAEIANTGLPIIAFAPDREGEAIILGFDGTIHRLVKNPLPDRSKDFPRRLSETGLFTELASLSPAPGVLPYRLQAHAYEGEAISQYVVGVPNDATIQLKAQKKQWVYPAGTVFAKTLSYGDSSRSPSSLRRIETQVLHFDGKSWHPYSYLWRDDQSDAELVGPDGANVMISPPSPPGPTDGVKWRVHSRAECISCHNSQAGVVAGWDFPNLNGPSLTSPTSRQFDELYRQGIFAEKAKPEWLRASMVDPEDSTASLEVRARSYLAINCSQCHCRGGGGTVPLELPFTHTLDKLNAVDLPPTQGSFGIEQAKVIAAGDPYRSVLFYRLATCGAGHMPKLWGRENDSLGLQLVHDWIRSLKPTLSVTPDATGNASKERTDRRPVAMPELSTSEAIPTNWDSTNQALQWFYAAESGRLEKAKVDELAKLSFSLADPILRGLFERFVPSAQRVPRLGNDIDPAAILAMIGDAERGRQRFLQASSQQCRLCHRWNQVGSSIGPDFDGIGKKRSREELLESILDPSRRIDPAYQSYLVMTEDEQVLTGLLVERTDATTTIKTADGKTHRLPNQSIESFRVVGLSMMPMGLAADMTAEELADLLAFLESLK